jgi:glycerol-3-phosphate dehydrogenase (NAD(P)+)
MIQHAEDACLAVIGAGSWGTTLANLLADKGERVHLWVRDPEQAERIARERTNTLYLPGFPVHATIRPTADFREVVQEADVFVSVVPSHATRAIWRVLGPLLPPRALVVSATKGIEAESLLTMSGVLRDTIPAEKEARIAVLSGPSFAREVSQKTPTAVVTAATDRVVAEAVQTLFKTPEFRVYTTTDVLGVELGGALKNVMALAAGVCDGLQFGYNARAALITRGLAEITQLGIAMGAKAPTFAGLSGMGDLVLTCTGDLSRNHAVGVQLGQGKKLQEILQDMRMVAEGVTTAGSAVALGYTYQVEMPIAERIHALLHGHMTPQDAVTTLMTRALKQEDG